MQDILKKLTGKNQREAQEIARNMLDNSDTELFRELVSKDDFLFDFVKQNISGYIKTAVNESNYKNLLAFLKYYSPSYEDAIVSVLVEFADEDLTDEMLDLLEHGTDDEKTYCAKFFAYIQDNLALDLLRDCSYSENDALAANSAATLGIMNDETSYNTALAKLDSSDEFEKLAAVKFLVSYGKKEALPAIIKVMKNSSMAENIAGEIPYLEDLFSVMNYNLEDALIVINNIINGLGEILSLSQVFDFELYEVLENLISKQASGSIAVILLNAREKFDILTENDEYLFDEDKDTKNEILSIKKLLAHIDVKGLKPLVKTELRDDSPFVYTALELCDDVLAIRELLKCNNQTVILKTAEVLKSLNNLDETTKTVALIKITDENIKSIIRAL